MGTIRVGATLPALLAAFAGCAEQHAPALRTDRALPVYVSRVDRDAPDVTPWLTVDVDCDHAVRYEDEIIFDPFVDDPIVLERAFTSLREAALDAGDVTTMPQNLDGDWQYVIREAVRLEGHKWSLWSTHAQILHAASRPGIGFWKVQMALFVPED